MPKRPRKSKLYTRAGDRGRTGLFGGPRVPKDHPRVDAYGTVDELNAAIGVAISFIRQKRLVARLHAIQNDLFDLGSELASVTSSKGRTTVARFRASRVERLEALIDEYDARVPPLRNFVLPSGSSAASFMHVARTVCRRGERAVVTLDKKTTVNPAILIYLNRLSDLLFVLARYLNKTARRREQLWQPNA